MPYSIANESSSTADLSPSMFGKLCQTITPGAGDQLDANGKYFKYFVAATDGDVTFTSFRGTDGATQAMTVSAGMILPGRIRRITASTATIHGWSD